MPPGKSRQRWRKARGGQNTSSQSVGRTYFLSPGMSLARLRFLSGMGISVAVGSRRAGCSDRWG